MIGKNYCYQTGAGATLFFEGRHFNPFMNAGGSNATIDDFNINWASIAAARLRRRLQRRRRLQHRAADRLPAGAARHAAMGQGMEGGDRQMVPDRDEHQRSGSVMANRYNYYDLDPTYRNAFGQPLMRMTFDYKENEHKIGRHAAETVNAIANR